MPLLFKEVSIQTNGMVCAEPFDLPVDGRKLFFNIMPGGGFRKDIFLMVDGHLQENVFANGSRAQTPITGLERLVATPHEAYAIVVDRTEVPLEPIVLPKTVVPVVFNGGRAGTVDVHGTLRASIFPEDTRLLAQEFANGTVSNPNITAAGCLKFSVMQAAATVIPAAMRQTDPLEGASAIPEICLELARSAIRETECRLPWCRVAACEVELVVDNMEAVVENANFVLNLQTEVKRKLLDAMLSTFGSSPLPAEVSQVIQAYIQTNPGLPGNSIQDFCKCVNAIWARGGPDALISAASQAGILLTKGG